MQNLKSLKKLILNIFNKNFSNLFFLTVFIFIGGFFETISLLSIVPIMDLIISSDSQNFSKITLLFKNFLNNINLYSDNIIFFIFIAFSILSVCFILLSHFFSQKIKYKYCNDLIKNTLINIYNSNLNFFIKSSQGKLINTFTREVQLVGDSLSSLSRLFSNIIQILFFLLIPIAISLESTVIILFILIGIYFPFIFLGKCSQNLGIANTNANNNFFNSLQEFLGFYKNILSFGLQTKITNIIETKFKISAKHAIKAYLLDSFISNIFIPITIIGILLVYFFSDLINLTFSELSVIMAAFYRISSKSNLLIKEYSVLNRSISSFDQINKINQDAQTKKLNFSNISDFNFKEKIIFKDVDFGHDEDNIVLSDLNFEIQQGSKVGFFGESGSGKSTLANLISRLIQPNKGRILLDGKNIFDIKIEQYTRNVSYVSQENILLNDTIFENFKLIKSDVTISEIEKLCEKLNLLNFIKNLPDGFNTILGEKGARFSGGQIQRISIARALIKNPKILILDEVTSALDKENTQIIIDLIDKIHKEMEITILIISHDLNLIKNTDYNYYLENKKLFKK